MLQNMKIKIKGRIWGENQEKDLFFQYKIKTIQEKESRKNNENQRTIKNKQQQKTFNTKNCTHNFRLTTYNFNY